MPVRYREADLADVEAMARIRAVEWETEEYWRRRIHGYMTGALNPQQALTPRVAYVASDGDLLIGYITGHLTRRYACDGELQWINVARWRSGGGVAPELLRRLGAWFAGRGAKQVCVDVDPDNPAARAFYRRHGADELNRHWMVWNDITTVLSPTSPV
jgi:RimJ/RimL family protein N-acetyltransferase